MTRKSMLLAVALLLPSLAVSQQPEPAPQADNEYQAGAVLWTQISGERRALCYQAFALARISLDQQLKKLGKGLPPAVVVDIDETILDNSAYQATGVLIRRNFEPKSWTEWVNLEQATAIPGALDFLQYAAKKRVAVYYITNRKDIEKQATVANLKALGFPNVTDKTLLVRNAGESSNKESRRESVRKTHRILLLMGDNLNDFAGLFEDAKTVGDRLAAVENNKEKFGTEFIVLPNPMYGDWESAAYDYDFKLTEQQKNEKRKSLLKGYCSACAQKQ